MATMGTLVNTPATRMTTLAAAATPAVCDGAQKLCDCLAAHCPLLYNESVAEKENCYMRTCFLNKRALEDDRLWQVTVFHALIFVVGVLGNLVTCIVIRLHPLLAKTHSSVYLFNLALSDLVTLLVGLPFEVYTNYHQWPWPLPGFACHAKAWILETTTSVSMLTILLFSMERYIAVCHPLQHVKLRPIRRHTNLLLVLAWLISGCCAAPFGLNHKADYLLKSWPGTDDRQPVLSSRVCMVDVYFKTEAEKKRGDGFLSTFFHFSALIFFALPLLIILTLCICISHKMRRRKHYLARLDKRLDAAVTHDELHLRISLILASVVGAFFVCYFPYHLQRLVFFYVKDSAQLKLLNSYLYFVSGVLFYLATCLNPIIYNSASARFRRASRDVLLCLLRPSEYSLAALTADHRNGVSQIRSSRNSMMERLDNRRVHNNNNPMASSGFAVVPQNL